MSFTNFTRRRLLQTSAVAGAGLALPTYLRAANHEGFTNAPTGSASMQISSSNAARPAT